jgi:hypothetical protein
MTNTVKLILENPARVTLHSGKALAYFIFVGCVVTAIAAIFGICVILVATFPFSLLGLLRPSQFFVWLWSGLVFAAPVTLMLLPGSAMLGLKFPNALYFSLPVIGLLGGYLAMRVWPSVEAATPYFLRDGLFPMGKVHSGSPSDDLFIWTGAFAGLIAGAIFSAALCEVRR